MGRGKQSNMRTKILTLLLAACALNASAGLKTTTLNGGTNNVAASTTNTTALTSIPVTSSDNFAMQVSFTMLNAANTGTFVVCLDRSIDNSVWQTNYLAVTCAPSGTNMAVIGTNLSTGAFAYWRVGALRNSTTNACTNLIVQFYYKLGI